MEHSDIEHMAQGYPPAHIAKDSEEVTVWLATQLLETQEQRDALAAENMALKHSADIVRALNANPEAARFCGFEDWQIDNAVDAMTAPATDAYLNSVRAEGVELVKAHPAISLCSLTHACEEIAAQLRAGKDGE